MTGFRTVDEPPKSVIPLPRPGETSFKVLEAVAVSWKGSSYGPTMEELRQNVGLATRSGVQFHVSRLLDLGLLSNTPNRRRTLKLTERGRKLMRVFNEMDG